MKKWTIGFTLVLVMCVGVQGADMRDSTNWATYSTVNGGAYEANVDGQAPDADPDPWATFNSPSPTVSDGIMNHPRTTTQNGYQRTDLNTVSTAFSLEYRARVSTEPTVNGAVLYCDFTTDISAEDDKGVGANGMYLRYDTTDGSFLRVSCGSDTYSNTDLDVTQFHTYRLTGYTTGQGPSYMNWNLYLDDSPTALASGYSPAQDTGTTIMYLLSYSNGPAAYELDWIRWTQDGAYEPVPEPVTLALLGLGGVLALLRRRR